MTAGQSARPVPARDGVAWLKQAMALIRGQALRLLVLGLMLQFLAGMTQVGLFGLLFFLCVPVFTAGMLQAVHLAAAGSRPPLLTLFAGFRTPLSLSRLVMLGALGLGMVIATVGWTISGILTGLEPQLLERLQAGDTQAVAELDPGTLQQVLVGLAAGVLFSGSLGYFAIPLIWFERLPFWNAVAKGLAGLVRHWRALLVMGALLALIAVPVVVLVSLSLSMQFADGQTSPVLNLLLMLAVVGYQLLLFATQYVSYRAAFPVGEKLPPPAGQLVA